MSSSRSGSGGAHQGPDEQGGRYVVCRPVSPHANALSRKLRLVPHTLSEDGDPIDVLIANTRPILPGAVINVRPIGVLKMEDDGGGDEKIIAVPSPHLTKRYVHVKNYTDLPVITLEQIQHFFEHYKDLEPGKWVKLDGWKDAATARQLIIEAIERAKRAA